MTDDVAEFEEDVLECREDLRGLLPGLRLRYGMLVITQAMAEHLGRAIWALRDKNLCDNRQARLALDHLEAAAFPEKLHP